MHATGNKVPQEDAISMIWLANQNGNGRSLDVNTFVAMVKAHARNGVLRASILRGSRDESSAVELWRDFARAVQLLSVLLHMWEHAQAIHSETRRDDTLPRPRQISQYQWYRKSRRDRWFLFTVGSNAILAWYIATIPVFFCNVLMLTFNLAFPITNNEVGRAILSKAIEVLFWFDMFMSFRSGYVDTEGKHISNPSTVANHYLYGWFAVDILACTPFILSRFGLGSSWFSALALLCQPGLHYGHQLVV